MSGSGEGSGSKEGSEELLPLANIEKLMKQRLPPNAKVSKDAKKTMQECVSEFIGFVTGEASEFCHREGRKIINGNDICAALEELGLDTYAETIRVYLEKYRENQNK